MPIKIVGAVMIFCAGFFWGWLRAGELLKREKSLQNIKTGLNMLESEIVFSSNYLKDAFLNISRISVCKEFFSDVAFGIEEFGASKAWENALEKNKKKLALKERDTEILKILASQLGKSDTEQQVKNIRHVKELLEIAQKEAREDYQNSSRLYRSMGILGGLFVIILLL